jgi:hypothetical protein
VTSFNLQVQFTGLCSFVPNDTFDNATKLMAVLPNADYLMDLGVPAPTALDGQPLARHRGFLKIPLSNLGTPTAPPDAVGIFYLAPGSKVTFETDFNGPLQFDVTSNPPDASSLMWLTSMAELMAGGTVPNDIDPAAVSATPPASVLAQVLIEAGFAAVTNLSSQTWAFQAAPPSPAAAIATLATQLASNLSQLASSAAQPGPVAQPAAPAAAVIAAAPMAPQPRQIAHEVTVVYKGISQAAVVIQNGGTTQRIALLPDSSNLANVRVLNVCDDNQLEWTRIPLAQPDVDFKWFYQMLPITAQQALQAALPPGGLVVPVPVGSGAGGVDCSPGMFGPAPF